MPRPSIAGGSRRPTARSSPPRQGYKDKRDCENSIDVIKKGAEKAKVEEAAAE